MKSHDVGVRIVRDAASGEIGYRDPRRRRPRPLADGSARSCANSCRAKICSPISKPMLRVYNLDGRRDNKYKARIKILVHEIGIEAIRAQVEEEFAAIDRAHVDADAQEFARIAGFFAPPAL